MSRLPDDPEAARLEALWAGGFGDSYVERNRAAGTGRQVYWRTLVSTHQPARVLEVGCNVGANLKWLLGLLPPAEVVGVDINERALTGLRQQVPEANAMWAQARDLPFRDGWFDLTFTAGVLIHQPDSTLRQVMGELVRCSSRLVLALEYAAASPVEVPYRGERGALFKRDYGVLYQQWFPELRLLEHGQLTKAEGWDDVTCWLFTKTPDPA